jgi:GH24 family phage-related lysozyme (muramidase)
MNRPRRPAPPLTPDQQDALNQIDSLKLRLEARKYITPRPAHPDPQNDAIDDDLRRQIGAETARLYADPVAPELARHLADLGRGGDSEVAHATPGEIVLHPSMLSPDTLARVVRDLSARGVGLGRVSVGSADAPRNPRTGAAEFDPTPAPLEPGRPTYWVDDPNDPFANIARPIPNDSLNGFVAGTIPDLDLKIPRPGQTPPPADWGSMSDPFGAWGRVMRGTGPMQIGRTNPISDAAAAAGLINYRQNLLPPGWSAPNMGPAVNINQNAAGAGGTEATPSAEPGSIEWFTDWLKGKEGDKDGKPLLTYQFDPSNGRAVVGGYGHDLGDNDAALAKLGTSITEAEARELLRLDIDEKITQTASKFDPNAWAALSPTQQSMLTSLAFNVGANALDGTRLQAKINAGDLFGAAQEWLEFNNITTFHPDPQRPGENIRLMLPDPGLSSRRMEEVSLFLGPDSNKLTLPPYYQMIMTPQIQGP